MKVGIDPEKLAKADDELDFANYSDDMEDTEDSVTAEQVVTEENEKKSNEKSKLAISPKTIVIGAFLILIAVICVFMFMTEKGKKAAKVVAEVTPKPTPVTSDYVQNAPEDSKGNSAGSELEDAEEFIKDINGKSVKLNYKPIDIAYTRDMVNYVKHRGTSDEGFELFWLDVVYKEKKYKVQIPYYVFTDLEKKGIVIVSMEKLTLKDGGEMITYMEVVSNYKELLGN